jgi:hypothetical protein
MGKVTDTIELREEIREKFRNHRGAMAAFCRDQGISNTWLTWVLSGKYESPELLVKAAEWLVKYTQEKRAREYRLAQRGADLLSVLQD